MKIILSILILQLFLVGLVSGQSATDMRKLKEQYESIMQEQGKTSLQSVTSGESGIDGDLPTKQGLIFRQYEPEKKKIEEKNKFK